MINHYSFENYRRVNLENYKELSDVFQTEMKQIAEFDTGYSEKSIEGFMNHCKEEFPENADWDLYDVVNVKDPEKVLFHFWKYLDEYGSLFHADTGNDADIGMMNFNFMLHNGSREAIQLAGDLQKSFYKE